ncbi:MAG: hypothetical protein K1Y02_18640 [Candidatus Hydrogenedentes bacterium]|nr:hypothetical protein [Candidatus Hydrogenedentota bacterium]
MRSVSSGSKCWSRCLVFAGVVVAVAILSPPAHAVNYNPSTAIMVYIHGFDNAGWTYTNVYGDDSTIDDIAGPVNQIATFTGRPTNIANPTAPNQVCGATYYGAAPPAWYTAEDIAADNALSGTYVPRYALRMAKYIKHVITRSGATSAIVLSGSFGTEITRYMIEHNLCNLASDQLISRWMPIVGVMQGNWAASSINYDLLGPIFGEDPSPDIDCMQYGWVDSNISAHATMNSAYYGPIIINQFVATADGDGYITALCNQPNDGTNNVSDEKFNGYTTTAALHAATDGVLQMPGLAYYPTEHTGIVDHMGMWAGVVSAAENNIRVTVTMTSFYSKTNGDLFGDSEWVFSTKMTSPRAQTLWGVTAPMTDVSYSDGVSPKIELKKGQTRTPNWVVFDMIIPAGESQLNFWLNAYELDFFNKFYDEYEIGSTKDMGAVSTTITGSTTTFTVSNGNYSATFSVVIKAVY